MNQAYSDMRMDLKQFVNQVISDLVQAVDESSKNATREVNLARRDDKRTIEFDVAVTAEESTSAEGKAGVRVLAFAEAGGNVTKDTKNSTVSRITFGVDVDTSTKTDRAQQQALLESNRRNISRNFAV